MHMKYWEKKWRLHVADLENVNAKKIIAENVEEAKGDPKGGDKLMRRDVEKDPSDDFKADPLISDWCKKFDYFPYQTLKNEWNPFLGEGAQGRVYSVTKNGKLYAVKLVSKSHGHGSEDEWEVRNTFANIYTKLPEHIKKHFPKIYDMGEYDTDDMIAQEGNTEYYYYVMEFLQPLEARYAKYFQGDQGGRADGGPFPVNAEEYDIFRTERYGDIQKVYNRLLTTLAAGNSDLRNIYTVNHLEVPYGEQHLEMVKQIKELADEVLYETWSRDLNKSLFAKIKSEEKLASAIRTKLATNYTKKNMQIKRLLNNLLNKDINKLPYGPDIIKKITDSAIKSALPQLNKFMENLFDQFAEYVVKQSIPYNYSSSGMPGFASSDLAAGIDVDLLRSGPITEFRQAMIHMARNYNLNVDDIKFANVMQRGKDLVMVDIGIWGF